MPKIRKGSEVTMAVRMRLVKTCGACPEQYEAFIGEQQVGYLRLRHGHFRVDVPDCGGTTVYEDYPEGDGAFVDDNERKMFLTKAVQAILDYIDAETLYEIEDRTDA